MEENPMYKMPAIDLSARSLLALAQLGFFCVFAYWGYEDVGTTIDWIFPIIMLGGGLALFISLPNARIATTLGIPAVMAIMAIAVGEPEMAFWAIFMILIIGSLVYIPALALGDSSLNLDESTRKSRFGILYTVFALFMVVMFSVLMTSAMDGEFTDDSGDGEDDLVYTLESNDQNIAQVGLALGIIGILVFVITSVFGVQLGPVAPWHGGALLSGAVSIDSYLWYTVADSGVGDIFFALAAGVIFTLSALIANDGSDSVEEE